MKLFNDSISRHSGKRTRVDTFYGIPILLSTDVPEEQLIALKNSFAYLGAGVNYVVVYPIEGIRDMQQLSRNVIERRDVTAVCIPVFEYSKADHGTLKTLNSFMKLDKKLIELPPVIAYSYDSHASFSSAQTSYDVNTIIYMTEIMCKALNNDSDTIFGQVNIPSEVKVTDDIAAFQQRFANLNAHDIAVMLPTIRLETGQLDTKTWSNFWALNPQGAVGIIQFFPNSQGGYKPLMTTMMNNEKQKRRIAAASRKYSFTLEEARSEFEKIGPDAPGTLRAQYEETHDNAVDNDSLGDGTIIDRIKYAVNGHLGGTYTFETRIFMPVIFAREAELGAEKISDTRSPFKRKWKEFYKEVFDGTTDEGTAAQAFQVSAAINGYLLPSRKNIKSLGEKLKLLYERIEFDRDVEQGHTGADSHWNLAHELYKERYKKTFTPELLTDIDILKFMRVYFLLRIIRARNERPPARKAPKQVGQKFTTESAFLRETDNTVRRPIKRVHLLELSDDNDVESAGIADFAAEFIDEYSDIYSQLTYAKIRALNKQGRLM